MTVPEYLKEIIFNLENPTQFDLDEADHIAKLREIAKRWEKIEKELNAMDCSPGMLPHPELDGYCAYCKSNRDHRETALAVAHAPLGRKGDFR